MKSFLILAALNLLPLSIHAQERTTAGPLDTQASWAALKNLVEGANMNAKVATILAEAIKHCGMQDKLYGPQTAGADTDGCKLIPAPSLAMQTVTASASGGKQASATATCPTGTGVTGGGGSCRTGGGGGWTWLNVSQPSGNGWYAECDTEKNGMSTTINVYARCLQTH